MRAAATADERPQMFAGLAAWELIQGGLRTKPQVVGKPLLDPYWGEWSAHRGTYRIRYRFDNKTVTVLHIRPRSTDYHP